MNSLPFFYRFAALLILTLLPLAAAAQTTTATIVGTVKDANGAALPSAAVTVTNTETNAVRNVTTDEEGNYNISNLPIGIYRVTAELANFKRSVLSPVQLTVNQTARLDIQLEAGNVSEQVIIEASTPLIESETSSVGQTISNQTIVQLPLNGRNFIRLGSLIPGTTEGAPGNSVVRDRQGGVALTSNGQRAEYNNFTLDGVDNNETLFGVAAVVPSVDAIQEFKVQTANFSAEFGRGSGANVNIAIKNGTNKFSGTVYEFVRNDVLDARNPFSEVKNPLRRNQYGFSLGGPVLLPRFGIRGDPVINLKNHTFFFINYESLIERRGFTTPATVPTLAQRSGDFSSLLLLPTPIRIPDLSSGKPCTAIDQSGCFPGNIIPANRFNAAAVRALNLYPLPNSTGANNYIYSSTNPLDNRQVNLRIDQNLTDNDQLFGRYSQTSSKAISRAINLNSQSTNINSKGTAISYSHVFSSNKVNDLRFGFQRYEFQLFPEGYGTNGAVELGLPSFITDPIFNRYPTLLVTGQSNFGGGISNPLLRGENTYQGIDNFSWTRGKHTIKFGGDVRYYQASNFQPQFPAGEYTFNGSKTNNSVADFLLGLPTQQRILNTTGFDRSRLRNWRVDLYAQDDFQISKRLTLNLGLRWERDGDWTEKNNRFGYFDPSTGEIVYPKDLPDTLKNLLAGYQTANAANPLAYKFRYADNDIMRPAQNKQFAPRIGFAFRPFNDNKTVVRAAFGIFWGQPIANVYLNEAFTPPPFSLAQTVTTAGQVFGVFPGVTPQTLVPVNPSFFTLVPDEFKNGYVQQWNVGVEHEIGYNIAVKASYVGSHGVHLERRYDYNAGQPIPFSSIANARRPYPQYGSIQLQESSASSSYHSLQLSAEKRFSNGFLFLAGYTYAKSLDDTSTWVGLGSQESAFPQNPRDLTQERGRSGFDLHHRFTLSSVYELPFHSDHRGLDLLIGGYQLSGILTLRTGYPFTVFVGSTDIANITGAGTANSRLDFVGDPFADVPEGFYFNKAAFRPANSGTFGNSGRNAMTGPGARQLDLSIMKVLRFSDRYSLQLRGEAFNVFNHPTLALPVGDYTNVNFGRVISSDNREMQLGVKFIF